MKKKYWSRTDNYLENNKQEILRLLDMGVTKAKILRQFKISFPTLSKKLKEWR